MNPKMGSIIPQLSLDLKPTYIPKSVSDFLGELSKIENFSERISKLDDFVTRLEEEMRKIDAFKRELPLSMILLNDAILTLKEEIKQHRTRNIQPVFEEFIPIKKTCDEDDKGNFGKDSDTREKMNWMSSVQLWSCEDYKKMDCCDKKQNSVTQTNQRAEEDNLRVRDNSSHSSINRNEGRAFMSFSGYSGFSLTGARKEDKEELTVSGLSLLTPGTMKSREELSSTGLSSKTSGRKVSSSSAPSSHSKFRHVPQPPHQQTCRKQRRCWSPELHRRFISALEQLGGSQVATPKQIKELMQVDGLTNDEVKSHLQKYRLHTKKLPGSANQPVVTLGNMWMPQDQCGESSKPSDSNSGSPQGPLQLTGGGTPTTGSDNTEEEEEEDDDKSERYSWKSCVHVSGKIDV